MPATTPSTADRPSRDTGTAGPLASRAADLGRLADTTWDVLIVGGGVVGAGALLDATSRGLTAALIEQDDIAAGTSSRSSRLIHGGLRYLEQVHLPLVREALAERRRLLRNAPHLVTLEPQLFPIYGIPFLHKAFYDAGLTLYDILGARHDGGWHRRLDRAGTLEIAPQLRQRGLRGGLLYHDGVEDDARFTLALVRTAQAIDSGQVVVTRVRADGVDPAGSDGSPRTIRVRDGIDGAAVEVRAHAVVDATGVWAADPDAAFAGPAGRLLPSRGAHLVVPRDRIPATAGITIRVPGKVVFLVPWPEFWLIGTTDAPYDGPPGHLAAASWEVDELLATANATMDVELTRDDVVGTYAGLRPLVADAGGSTVKASREHRVMVTPKGVVRIGGGKYTTYRVMARDVIDGALGRDAARRRPSDTADRPLIGAADRPVLDDLAERLGRDPELAAIHPQAATRLVARHGSEAPDVLALARDTGFLRPLVTGRPFLAAEVIWAVRHELALTVDDILSRRLRLSPELADRGVELAPRVAAIMAGELGWDGVRAAREAETYLASAAVEYGVPSVG
jgi:glycerol-3-phosphate dehydrogenase